MNPISYIIPFVILYTSSIIYLFNYKIIHKFNNSNSPIIFYFITYITILLGILGILISFITSYTNCKRWNGLNLIKSFFTLSIWQIIIIFILLFLPTFRKPFDNIWSNDNNKSLTIALSFFLSIFAILSSIVVYYDTRMNVCGPDANAIEENVKELDTELNS
jgi:H+/Cl- antiporter ClcA